MVRPTIAVLLRRAGLDGLTLAVVLSAYNVAPLVLALPVSEVCRHRSPRLVLGLGCLLTAAVLPGFTVTRMPAALLMLQISLGVAMISVIVAGQVLVSNLPAQQGLVFPVSHYSLGVSLGGVVGPALGGLLGQWGGLHVPMWGGAAAGLAAALFILTAHPPSASHASRPSRPQASAVLTELVRRPLFRAGLLVSFGLTFALTLRGTYYVVFLEEQSWSLATIGLLVSLSSGAGVAVRALSGPLLSRVPMAAAAGTALLVGGLGVAAVPFAPNLFVLGVSALAWGFAIGFNQPIGMLLVAMAAPQQDAALAVGSRVFLTRVAALLLPLLFGLVASRWGNPGGFHAVGGLLAVMGVLAVLALRGQGRP